jgi:hypothetical protein
MSSLAVKVKFDEQPAALANALGMPQYMRRLSDKILAAFNHAYATGEYDIADKLWAVLGELDSLAEVDRRLNRPEALEQRRSDALGHAQRWVSFVEARNLYRAAMDSPAGRGPDIAEAMAAMKEAYRRWALD